MKRFRFLVVPVLLIALLVVGGVRLAIVASGTETGWESIATRWQDATLSWLGLGHTAVDIREPSVQADFWLDEVDRILQSRAVTADLCIGAAIVLDSPGTRFVRRYVKRNEIASGLPQWGLTVDYEAVDAAKAQFEERCSERCLSLARRATELDPSDVRWWRIRALLQFRPAGMEPRHNDWLAVLDEGSRHDPDNALYDYLAAEQLCWAATDVEWVFDDEDLPETDESRLTIKDPDLFRQGIARFDRAQRKSFLAAGEEGVSAVPHLLNTSRIPHTDRAEIARSRMLAYRYFNLLNGLRRWQNVRVDHARQTGEPSEQVALLTQKLRLFDQVAASPGLWNSDFLVRFASSSRNTYQALTGLARESPTCLSEEQLQAITDQEKARRTESMVLKRAFEESIRRDLVPDFQSVLQVIVADTSRIVSAILLWIVGAMFVAGRLLDRRGQATGGMGVIPHLVAWTIGCGGSFVVLGMAPAEVISREAQNLAACIAVWGVAAILVALVVWLVFRFFRQRNFRFSLRSLFAVMTGAAIIAFAWPVIVFVFAMIAEHPPEVWLRAKGFNGIDAGVLRFSIGVDKGTFFWAFIQWNFHGGPFVAIAVSLLLVAGWFVRRTARQAGEGIFHYWTRDLRRRWSKFLRFAGKSAAVAAVCCLIVHLWTAPAVIRWDEGNLQEKMRFHRSPQQYWNDIEMARSRIMSSADEMRWFHDLVDTEIEQDEDPTGL